MPRLAPLTMRTSRRLSLMAAILVTAWCVMVCLLPAAPPKVESTSPSIVGPDKLATGHPGWLSVDVTPDQALVFWPVAGAELTTGPPHLVTGHALFWTDKAGTYQINALVVDWKARQLTPLQHTIVVGDSPNPHPGQEPEPEPGPTPGPKWIGLIYESAETGPQAASVALLKRSQDLRNYVTSHGHTWRLIDKDEKLDPVTAEVVRRALAQSIPRIVVVSSGGVELLSRPPPEPGSMVVDTVLGWLKELDGER